MWYKAVVETGNRNLDRKRWEERATCGHAHRTAAAAAKCLKGLRSRYCEHGHKVGNLCARCGGTARGKSTSALWYNGVVHNQDGERTK